MKYFIGIDGGGTNTTFLLINEMGTALDLHILGCTNYEICGMQTAVNTLQQGIGTLLERNHISFAEIGCIGMGLSGMDFQRNIDFLEEHLPLEIKQIPHWILNDLWIAFEAAGDVSYGAVSISGTGHNAGVLTPNGIRYGINAMRYPLGNFGGGRMLTDQVFHVAFQSYEYIGPRTLLEERLPAFCSAKDMDELLLRVEQSGYTYQYKWEIPRLVDEAALAGDAVSQELLHRFGYRQGKITTGLLNRASMAGDKPLIVLAGSIYTKFESTHLLDGYKLAIQEACPSFVLKLLHRDPVQGAALLTLCRYYGQNETEQRLRWMEQMDQSIKEL